MSGQVPTARASDTRGERDAELKVGRRSGGWWSRLCWVSQEERMRGIGKKGLERMESERNGASSKMVPVASFIYPNIRL